MIVKATSEHLSFVLSHIRDSDRKELLLTQWGDSISEISHAPGAQYAVLRDGLPVCVFGVVPLFPGVGQGWLIGTDEIGKSGVEVAHACQTVVNTLLDGHMHRIQADSAEFHTQAHTWLELIGFSRESRMVGFGKDGTDFFRYAICRRFS